MYIFYFRFLQHLVMPNSSMSMGSDYRIALLCNAYSTNHDYFSRPMAALFETIMGTQKVNQNLKCSFNNRTNFFLLMKHHFAEPTTATANVVVAE